jgi:hypothetical protein
MMGRLLRYVSLSSLVAALLLATGSVGQADDVTPPDWVGKLVSANTNLIALSSPSSTQEELPGLGHKFELFFAMHDDQDPQNPTNDVISMVATPAFPAGVGVAFRNLPPGIKIAALDHQMHVRYFFPPPGTCQNGGPRIQLAIDLDGDGNSNGNAFGYVGNAGFGAGCVSGEWDVIDMTDNVPFRWDLTQLGLGFHTWDTAEAAVSAFPNHQVLSGALVDDGCAGGGPLACGQRFFDLVTIENRTLEQDQDTVDPAG